MTNIATREKDRDACALDHRTGTRKAISSVNISQKKRRKNVTTDENSVQNGEVAGEMLARANRLEYAGC